MHSRIPARLLALAALLLLTAASLRAQSQDAPVAGHNTGTGQNTGTVRGTVLDQSGDVVTGAVVSLAGTNNSQQKITTDNTGEYVFPNIAAGEFHLSITAKNFSPQSQSGSLQPGEIHVMPAISLTVAAASTSVTVHASHQELAEQQIKADEQQRLIGFIPNFYIEYDHAAVSLSTKQKYELAWKSTFDWTSYPVIAGIAGVQQAQNSFSGYGQGAQGYAKRYGAAFATFTIGAELSGAVLPSLLKQDPRYFYKGTGSTKSRFLYAIANSVICKGDNGHWQPNYSAIGGNLAAAGISNLYYPAADRNGAALTFENALVDIAAGAAENVFEEFFSRKFSRGLQK
jgi:hypothetical protein